MKDRTFEKHKLVIDEYFLNGFNGTQAYLKFYDCEYTSADTSFREILENPRIKEYYNQKHKDAQELSKIDHFQVLQELKNWAYSDITQTMSLKPYEVEQLPPDVKRLITKFKKTTRRIGDEMTEETIELQFVSKEKAIDMINKHIGFYGHDNYQRNSVMTTDERERRIAELKSKMDNAE